MTPVTLQEHPTKTTKTVAQDLQTTLVELLDLGLQAKQAHWNVRGTLFRPLHLQLDEMVDQYREWSDDVAERVVAIGVPADGRAATVSQTSRLSAFPEGFVRDASVVDLFVQRLVDVAERLGERVARLGDIDPVTQDLLIEVQRGLEKQRWMLVAQAT